jgi:DNA-binding GntR family transcriptional regulator
VTVTDTLRAYVSGHLVQGDQLETAFQFAQAFAVDVTEVQKARDELVADGLLRRVGSVYVVTNTLPSDDTPSDKCEDDRHAQ